MRLVMVYASWIGIAWTARHVISSHNDNVTIRETQALDDVIKSEEVSNVPAGIDKANKGSSAYYYCRHTVPNPVQPISHIYPA